MVSSISGVPSISGISSRLSYNLSLTAGSVIFKQHFLQDRTIIPDIFFSDMLIFLFLLNSSHILDFHRTIDTWLLKIPRIFSSKVGS